MEPEHSRPLRLAGQATGRLEETLLGRLQASRVVLSLDPGRNDCAAVAELLVDTLRRLPIRLAVPGDGLPEGVVAGLAGRAAAIDPGRPLERGQPQDGDLRVHIGWGAVPADLRAVPERHGAHVTTRAELRDDMALPSGLGIATCAALLAGEVFKRVALVTAERATMHEQLAWCPVTLGHHPAAAPPLEEPVELDLALVGLGAIGSAAARILSLLPIRGEVALVDPERFAPENLGTYSLGNASDCASRPWKVELAARALPTVDTSTYNVPVEQFIQAVDRGEGSWPRLVLSGLDSAHARRETQRLWPDRLLDGATGDTMCGLHDIRPGEGACLICLFPVRRDGPSAAERLAQATGLPTELLRYGDQPLTEGHLACVSPEQRRLLEAQLGKPVCGLAEAVGLTTLESVDYRPSVPFVSQQAACLMVGRLLVSVLGLGPQPSFVQYDALIGPQAITAENRSATTGCFCRDRADVIATVRAKRAAGQAGSGALQQP
jgi:ThiF family protein